MVLHYRPSLLVDISVGELFRQWVVTHKQLCERRVRLRGNEMIKKRITVVNEKYRQMTRDHIKRVGMQFVDNNVPVMS